VTQVTAPSRAGTYKRDMRTKRVKAIATIMDKYGMCYTDAEMYLDGCLTAALDIILQGPPVYNLGDGLQEVALSR
jgi:hypothetical protein